MPDAKVSRDAVRKNIKKLDAEIERLEVETQELRVERAKLLASIGDRRAQRSLVMSEAMRRRWAERHKKEGPGG